MYFQEATESWSLHYGGDSREHEQSGSQQVSSLQFLKQRLVWSLYLNPEEEIHESQEIIPSSCSNVPP